MFGYMVIARSILAQNEASAESRSYIGRLVGPGPDWKNGCQIVMEKEEAGGKMTKIYRAINNTLFGKIDLRHIFMAEFCCSFKKLDFFGVFGGPL